MKVFWSKRAQQSYLNTLELIVKKWSLKEAESFEEKVFSFVKTLSRNKHLCPPSQIINLHKCVVSKQTSLTYKLSGNTITLELISKLFLQV